MLTRSSSKRKLVRKTIVKKKKGNQLRSFSGQRSQSKAKPQYITCSSISTHDDNPDENDDSSLGNDSLIIDCPGQPQHGRSSTPKKLGNCNAKELNIKKAAPKSSITSTPSLATADELTTEYAIKKLDAVISSCTPIVGAISRTSNRNISSFTHDIGSVVLDADDDEVILPPQLSRVTPTPNRNNLFHSSGVNRSEPRTNQHASSSTIAPNSVSRILSSSKTTTSSYPMRESGARNFDDKGSSNINRNLYGTPKNSIRSSINTQSISGAGGIGIKPIAADKSSISFLSTNSASLESIPEYRKLKMELELEKKRCKTWSDDYKKLRTQFDDYRASSFPRPSVDGLNFLLQLVENLTVSDTLSDTRSRSALAAAIGLTEEQLIDCCHPNPQRAALLVFSKLYPTYYIRAKLIDIKKFSQAKSKLLDDILVFARQCSPSTGYSMDKMRDAIASSIRQAKHQINKYGNFEPRPTKYCSSPYYDGNNIDEKIDNSHSMMDADAQHHNNNHSCERSVNEFDYQMDQE